MLNCSIEMELSIRESHAISKSWDAASIDLLYAWCTDASRSTAHAYSRCDVSVSLASPWSRSPVPALGFRKIRDPTWRKSISNRPNKLDKLNREQGNSAAALQSILSKATAPLPAMGTSSCIPAQPSSPVNFGRPHPSCVCVLAALPAHSTLVCSSLLLLQLLVTYALVRRKASSGMQRTCSDRASQSLGPI